MAECDAVGETRDAITTLGAAYADDPYHENTRHEAASEARAIGDH